MTTASRTNADRVRDLYAAIESRTPLSAAHFTPDAETVELPNRIKPNGARAPLDTMLANSAAGTGLLARQHYAVDSLLEIDDLVIARLIWTGTVAKAVGPFSEGQELIAHIAQFVTFRDGLIARIETYDCYEPFEPRPSGDS